MRKALALIFTLGLIWVFAPASLACNCPELPEITEKNLRSSQLIARVKIDSVKILGENGRAKVFVEALYKGKAFEQFWIDFKSLGSCALTFSPGEVWLIYGQIPKFGVVTVDFCSRSRKWFANSSEDAFLANSLLTFEEEENKLTNTFGRQALLKAPNHSPDSFPERELLKPKGYQTLWLLIASAIGFLLFYFLFSKYFK